jgi:general secretion pathway protein B
MSSILKALQKLERDREARQAKPADIQRGILRPQRRTGTPSPWKLPLAVCLAALLAALGTWLLMRTDGRQQPVAAPAATAPAPGPVPAEAQPAIALPSTAPAPLPQVVDLAPQRISADRPYVTAPPAPAPALDGDDAPQLPAEPARQAASPSPPPTAAAPQFSVAGIGWRDDPASRMAMVNGTPVRVGSSVDGARVEEILPDRVRFSWHQQTFEVPVGKSGSPSP